MDSEAWCAEVHGVTKSWTQLSDRAELNWSIERSETPQVLAISPRISTVTSLEILASSRAFAHFGLAWILPQDRSPNHSSP